MASFEVLTLCLAVDCVGDDKGGCTLPLVAAPRVGWVGECDGEDAADMLSEAELFAGDGTFSLALVFAFAMGVAGATGNPKLANAVFLTLKSKYSTVY